MRLRRMVWAVGLVAGLGVTVVRSAWAQASCAQTLPWPLVTFCADAPARAADVNRNFEVLTSAIVQRTGALDAGVALPAGSVASVTIIDGTIGSSDLATGAVTTAAIADSTVVEADLYPGLKCPDASRTTWGQCIFYRGGSPPQGAYVYNLRQAAAACRAEGARLCTLAELSAAWAAGLENCSYGWVADSAGPSAGTAAFPMQSSGVPGCGTNGVNTISSASGTVYGGWCCK